jgi:hypothetical protein
MLPAAAGGGLVSALFLDQVTPLLLLLSECVRKSE